MSKKLKREKIKLTYEVMFSLWDGVYHKDSSVKLNDDIYTHIDKINTSEKSDGESHDYIVQRKSDGKYFKFNVWDAGYNNGYIFSDETNTLEEVFPEKIEKINWK